MISVLILTSWYSITANYWPFYCHCGRPHIRERQDCKLVHDDGKGVVGTHSREQLPSRRGKDITTATQCNYILGTVNTEAQLRSNSLYFCFKVRLPIRQNCRRKPSIHLSESGGRHTRQTWVDTQKPPISKPLQACVLQSCTRRQALNVVANARGIGWLHDEAEELCFLSSKLTQCSTKKRHLSMPLMPVLPESKFECQLRLCKVVCTC